MNPKDWAAEKDRLNGEVTFNLSYCIAGGSALLQATKMTEEHALSNLVELNKAIRALRRFDVSLLLTDVVGSAAEAKASGSHD
jgi:hypothetical protein